MIVNVYSTKVCPKCKRLKAFFISNGIAFESLDMQEAENLAELRFNQIFTNNAPVLQVEDRFYTVEQIFKGTELLENKVLEVINL
ncbi:MAG: NrdH-redoxin [Clostridia bacterium]|jgi:glutaredoxin|nr:NrdH-redoxin [Clostridia bacterium]